MLSCVDIRVCVLEFIRLLFCFVFCPFFLFECSSVFIHLFMSRLSIFYICVCLCEESICVPVYSCL